MINKIHPRALTFFILGLFLYLKDVPAQNRIKQYPVKYNAEVSKIFKVLVNGEEVFVEDYKDIHYEEKVFALYGNQFKL